jgi:hypothetical protein
MDEGWADDVREGEQLDDDDLAVLRIERRQRELVDLLIAGGATQDVPMLSADEATRTYLLGEGFDKYEVDEAYRRFGWLWGRAGD